MKNSVTRKVVIAIVITVGILLLLFLAREVAIRFFGYKPPALSESQIKNAKQVEIVMESDVKYSHAVADKYIYFVTPDKISVADNGGNLKSETEIVTSKPLVKSKGKYVCVADIGGKNAYLLSGTDLKSTVECSGKIIDMSVNSSGYTVLVTEGDMHKRDVTVYNVKGEEQFVWNSGSMFVLNAAIADNNKNIVISTLDTSNGKTSSQLSFYNISNPDPVATEVHENELIVAVEICGNYVYCIGDTKTNIYRISGDKNGDILYGGKNLITYKAGNSNVVFAFSESALSGKRYKIETYNNSGKEIGKYELDYKINFIDYAEDSIAISRGRLINIIDTSGREKKLIDPGIDISSIRFLDGSSEAVGFTANGAYIFSTR